MERHGVKTGLEYGKWKLLDTYINIWKNMTW